MERKRKIDYTATGKVWGGFNEDYILPKTTKEEIVKIEKPGRIIKKRKRN